jgi:replication factor A1
VTVTLEKKRYDGTQIRQAEAIVGDQYGCVKLVARDNQLDVVKEGAVITVRNAHANVVNEHLRLEVDRWGKIESSSEKIPSVNLSNNHSDVEYELVSVRK